MSRSTVDQGLLRILVEQGRTQEQIASELCVSRKTIWRWMHELGIEWPTRSRLDSLAPIPERIGREDRLKLEYIRAEIERGRSADDEAALRERYREVLRSPNPDPVRLSGAYGLRAGPGA